MARDASDFPFEGQNFNSEQLLPSVDALLMNMGSIQRRIGAAPPEYVPDYGRPQNVQHVNNPNPKPNGSMPSAFTVPDAPKVPVSVPYAPEVSISPINFVKPTVKENNTVTYFKDGAGNNYKTVGDSLYVLGWQDADVEIRVVSEKTGKTIPSNGKKFQIYGWHLVKKISDADETKRLSKIDDIDCKMASVKVDKKDKTDVSDVKTVPTTETASVSSDVKNEHVKTSKKAKRLI